MTPMTRQRTHKPAAGGTPVDSGVRFPLEAGTEWECLERMPRYDDIHEYEVWVYGSARAVRRIGNRSAYFAPGTLVFTDCTHPAQNVLCHEPDVLAWRMKPNAELTGASAVG